MLIFRCARLAVALLVLPAAAVAELRLVIVEQPGCIYCRAWDKEISAIYPKTEEGKLAPLTRIELRAELPDDMQFDRPAVFTPTFVLLQDGAEIGRIEGYPGADFFWGLLSQMIEAQASGLVSDSGVVSD